MAQKPSWYEEQFRAKYPHAHHVEVPSSYRTQYIVYAGDYLCAEAHSLAEAYRIALWWDEADLITPDPNEVAMETAVQA